MSKDIFTVDAFSEVAFKGNPAAVVLLHADDELSDTVLQAIAEELNLSETAFVRPIAGGDATGEYSLRWFTPTNEVPLCGHATLASAHALFSHPSRGLSLPRILRFDTHSGQLTVERLLDGDLCMVLPLNAPTACSHSTCGPEPCFFEFTFAQPHICSITASFADTFKRVQLLLEVILFWLRPCLSALKN